MEDLPPDPPPPLPPLPASLGGGELPRVEHGTIIWRPEGGPGAGVALEVADWSRGTKHPFDRNAASLTCYLCPPVVRMMCL